jgi:hypothetical protein
VVSFVAEDAPTEELQKALAGSVAPPSTVHLKTNIPLISRGQDLILVEVGGGKKFQPTENLLLVALGVAGVDPPPMIVDQNRSSQSRAVFAKRGH